MFLINLIFGLLEDIFSGFYSAEFSLYNKY